jgi:hypothetical protein
MRRYLYGYNFQGMEFSFEIPAESQQEADDRLRAIQRAAYFDGEVMNTMSADLPGSGLIVRLLVWLGNLFK